MRKESKELQAYIRSKSKERQDKQKRQAQIQLKEKLKLKQNLTELSEKAKDSALSSRRKSTH